MPQPRPALEAVTLAGDDYDKVRLELMQVRLQLLGMVGGDDEVTQASLQEILTRLDRVQRRLEDPIFRGPQEDA